MNKECIQIIKEVASKKKDDDLYLKILTKIIEHEGSYANMVRNNIEISDVSVVSEILLNNGEVDAHFQDLRLKQLTFFYFRTFPGNEKPYSVLFENNNQPCSTFLVGRNSTGKSTIFDAIEYYYTKIVSNAKMKNIPEDKVHEYLTYGFGKITSPKNISTEDVHLKVKTMGENGNYWLNQLNPSCVPAMFCSEYDIFKVGELEEKGLETFVFEQLGYSDLLTIQNRLELIAQEIIEETNRLELSDSPQNDNVEKNVFLEPQDVEEVTRVFIRVYVKKNVRGCIMSQCESFKNSSSIIEEINKPQFNSENILESEKLFKEKWEILQKNLPTTDSLSLDSDIQNQAERLSLMYDLLYMTLNCDKVTDAFILFTKRQNEAQDFVKRLVFSTQEEREESIGRNKILIPTLRVIIDNLNSIRHEITNSFVEQYGSFIEGCLKYFSEDKETFKLNNDIKIVINVSDEKEGNFTSMPAWYLNSFRYKLYAVALKLSLAFWYMQKNKCIFPIAIDDVFNANDFDNSIHLQQFVHSIYDVYHDKVCRSIPLQLIMLTHDEIILNAFSKGYNVKEIKEWGASENARERSLQKYNLYKDNCIKGRLYPYEESEYINSNLKNHEFYNLYQKLN